MSNRRQQVARIAACAGGLVLLGAMSMTPTTSSYLYDLETAHGVFEAGEWAVVPAACDIALKHPHWSIIEGDEGDNVLAPVEKPPNGQWAQAILGHGGNDTISGGNQHDCLVGGAGDDLLSAFSVGNGHENGKDVLLGGSGDDHLVAGNGKDYLDGGDGYDVCEGDHGKDTIVNCEEVLEPEDGDGDGNGNGKKKDPGAAGPSEALTAAADGGESEPATAGQTDAVEKEPDASPAVEPEPGSVADQPDAAAQ